MAIIALIHVMFIWAVVTGVQSEAHGRWLLRWVMHHQLTTEIILALGFGSTLGVYGGVAGVMEVSVTLGLWFISNRVFGMCYRNWTAITAEWNKAPE